MSRYHHYTSDSAFISILQSGSFWLTNGRFLNDPLDCHNRADEILALAEQYLDGQLKKVFLSLLDFNIEAYVASFTSSDDDLVHWRAYGDDGHGVSLGFDPGLITGIEREVQGIRINNRKMLAALPVIYHRERLDVLLHELFRGVAAESKGNDDCNALAVKVLLTSRLFLCCYKENGWIVEQERRLIHMSLVDKDILPRAYRVKRGHLYDYAVTDFESGALKSITLGPKCSFEVDMVKRFTESLGYDGVTINRSALRYR